MPPPFSVAPSAQATGGYDGCPVSTSELQARTGFGGGPTALGVVDDAHAAPENTSATAAVKSRSFIARGSRRARAAPAALVRKALRRTSPQLVAYALRARLRIDAYRRLSFTSGGVRTQRRVAGCGTRRACGGAACRLV